MTEDEPSQAKPTIPCHICHMLVHWGDAHNPDGSLKPGTSSFDPNAMKSSMSSNNENASTSHHLPTTSSSSQDYNRNSKPLAIGFMAKLSFPINDRESNSDTIVCFLSVPPRSSRIGPMVNDGAPFSAIGNTELRFHRKRLTGH